MNSSIADRRHIQQARESALKRGINEEQLDSLNRLERFGWSVKFVRSTSTGPIAVVRDPDKRCLAVIEADGQLNEKSLLSFRA